MSNSKKSKSKPNVKSGFITAEFNHRGNHRVTMRTSDAKKDIQDLKNSGLYENSSGFHFGATQQESIEAFIEYNRRGSKKSTSKRSPSRSANSFKSHEWKLKDKDVFRGNYPSINPDIQILFRLQASTSKTWHDADAFQTAFLNKCYRIMKVEGLANYIKSRPKETLFSWRFNYIHPITKKKDAQKRTMKLINAYDGVTVKSESIASLRLSVDGETSKIKINRRPSKSRR